MSTTTIPKSLHTVTVLVAVARLLPAPAMPLGSTWEDEADTRVAHALIALGYGNTPDTYELGNKARKILAKDAPVRLQLVAA